MAKYVCTICRFVYDEDVGIPSAGIAPGTKWSDLPDDWVCPLCKSPKSEFEPMDDSDSPSKSKADEPVRKVAESHVDLVGSVSVPAGHIGEDLRELSFAEMAVLCSNLSKGCEKQYLMEESDAFRQISEYYMAKAGRKTGTFDDLMGLIEEGIVRSEEALDVSKRAGDRGAHRATLWNVGVSKVLRALMDRYAKNGDRMLENTNVYVCDICGFIYVGDEPPEICPVCKVPNQKLLRIGRD